MFIPKADKASHVTSKDFRPISLSSFLLKTFERLLEVYMKSTISSRLLSDFQHAYRKRKSTEKALHSIVSCIERSIHQQEFTLLAFLDIEAASNNVHPEAIMRGLQKLNIATPLINLIQIMLRNRKVLSTLGSSTAVREVK